MASNTKKKNQIQTRVNEPDSAFLFKIILYLIIGSQWIRLVDSEYTKQIPIPLGFIIGVLFAMHEHFKIDRKIEYAVLLVAMFIGFWVQTGLYVTILK